MSETELKAGYNLLDNAARKSDRWWFLVLLMVGMCWAAWERYETRNELTKRDERIAVIEKQYVDHLSSANAALVVALSENTRVLENNARILERVSEGLRKN